MIGRVVVDSHAFLGWLTVCTLAVWVTTMTGWRRRRGLAVSAGVVALIMSLTTAADAVNVHYSYLPRIDDVVGIRTWPSAPAARMLSWNVVSAGVHSPAREVAESLPESAEPPPRGVVITLPIRGTHSGFGTRDAYIYLPPQYFTHPLERFPVVMLLHGSPGGPIDWFRSADAADAGLLAARAGHPQILVAPRASRGWTDDSECVDRLHERVETYLVQDVVPTIDRELRTIPNRNFRAIGGVSAGGFCALNIGLRHRDVFGAILDLSGLDRPTFPGGMRALFGPLPNLAAVVAANTPAVYGPLLAFAPRERIWLDCGQADGRSRRDVVAMARVLRARGQQVLLRIRGGGHDYGVWRPALRESLLWWDTAVQP